jgi:hypothetical protein
VHALWKRALRRSSGLSLLLVLQLLPLDAASVSAGADVVQAVATVGALIAAGFAWFESHKLNDRETDRDSRQEQERRREGQAAHINAWPQWRGSGSQPYELGAPELAWTTAAAVSNTSRLPLYSATLFMGWAAKHGVFVGVRIPIELIPPGESRLIPMPDHAYQFAINSGAFEANQLSSDDDWPPSQIPPISVALQFRDWMGTIWVRDTSGALVPTADSSGTFFTTEDPSRAWSIIAPPPSIPPGSRRQRIP